MTLISEMARRNLLNACPADHDRPQGGVPGGRVKYFFIHFELSF